MDITADVDDIDDMKKRVVKLLKDKEVAFPNHKSTDGWCVGFVKYWTLVKGCWGL